MRNLPSPRELQDAWEDVQRIHAQHLASHGVKLPQAIDYRELGRSIQLAVLYYYEGETVDKNLISEICQRDAPHLAADQQVRHLKRDGWHLTGRGSHALNPYKVSPEFETDKRRRQGTLSAKNFDELKEVFGNQCATCGAKEGETNPRYGDDIVELQRGHKDPDKPMTLDNIIPQCQFCNRAYRRDYVFDDKGRVSHIADVRPVKKASKTVQRKVWEWLKNKVFIFVLKHLNLDFRLTDAYATRYIMPSSPPRSQHTSHHKSNTDNNKIPHTMLKRIPIPKVFRLQRFIDSKQHEDTRLRMQGHFIRSTRFFQRKCYTLPLG